MDLKKSIIHRFGCDEGFIDIFFHMFQMKEALDLLKAIQEDRPLTLRVNTIKVIRQEVAAFLIHKGVRLAPLGKWSRVGLIIHKSVMPIGITAEYLAGYVAIQGGSSLLACLALAPCEGETIVDMSAAPGMKATYIAALMKNKGILIANDINKIRLKALMSNIQRLGVKNALVVNHNGSDLPRCIGLNRVDRLFLDAPSSGTGLVIKDPYLNLAKSQRVIMRCNEVQKRLIIAAIDMVDPKSRTGGYIVYSTSSLMIEENEKIIDFAKDARQIKVISTGLDFGRNGFVRDRFSSFHPSLRNSKRMYPHLHNLEGLFVCKIKKSCTYS